MANRFKIVDLPPQSALKPFVQEFLTDRTEELDQLDLAINNSNLDIVKSTAHKWKGFSDPYGFQTLTKYAIALEQEALDNNANNCKITLKEIRNYLEDKKEQLNA